MTALIPIAAFAAGAYLASWFTQRAVGKAQFRRGYLTGSFRASSERARQRFSLRCDECGHRFEIEARGAAHLWVYDDQEGRWRMMLIARDPEETERKLAELEAWRESPEGKEFAGCLAAARNYDDEDDYE